MTNRNNSPQITECEPEPEAASTGANSSSAAPPRRNTFDAPRNTEAKVENLGVLGGMRVKRKSDAISGAAADSKTASTATTATATTSNNESAANNSSGGGANK